MPAAQVLWAKCCGGAPLCGALPRQCGAPDAQLLHEAGVQQRQQHHLAQGADHVLQQGHRGPRRDGRTRLGEGDGGKARAAWTRVLGGAGV